MRYPAWFLAACRGPTRSGHEMPALPWSARSSLPPTYACFVTASRQALRRYRDVPAFLRHVRAVRRRLRDGDGVLGYALAARLHDRTFWTVSAWVDPAAANAFTNASGAPAVAPGPALAASISVSWSCLAEELPVGWDEVRRRLRDAGDARRRGAVPSR